MHAGGIDRQRQQPVQRPCGGEDVAVALARLDRQVVDSAHPRRPRRPRARGVHDCTAGDDLAGFQGYAVDRRAGRIERHADDFVGDIFGAAFPCNAPPPVEHGGAVEGAFVDRVVVGGHDVVQTVERIFGRDFVRRHVPCAGAAGRLDRLCFPQGGGKGRGVRQIQVAGADQRQRRHPRIVIHPRPEILDEFGGKLRDPHIDRAGKLLPHAAVGVRRRGKLVGRIALHDEHGAVEIRVARQPPRDRRPVHRPANDDDIVAVARRRLGGEGAGRRREGHAAVLANGKRPPTVSQAAGPATHKGSAIDAL